MFSKSLRYALRLLLIASVLASIISATLVGLQPVYAQSEAPLSIVTEGVTSFDLPSPGLFYHTAALCPPGPGPNAAAADAPAAQSPDATEAASPFSIWRTTVRVEDWRALQFITDESGPDACNPHKIYSNIVADENFVYWVDATGLVKLPVTANVGDTPILMNEAYGFELPVELLNDGDRLIAVSNLPVANGPIGATGGSYVEAVDKTTGAYDVLYRAGTPLLPQNKYFRNVKSDGKYIYFVDEDRVLVRLDASGEDEGQAFGVVVDFMPGTRSYEIVEVASGETRSSGEVSANVPTVTNVALDSPPNPVTGTVTLVWEAADADGDALTYDVFYSVDAGTSYQPVVLGVSEASTPVDTSSLAGGQGRFRVYANDGVNQGEGESPNYTMAVKAPQVKIIRPADGERFNWGELVNFSGEALDPQDGLILGPSLTWANQKASLGNGGQISMDNLPVGANVITLSAQNSAGVAASKQITIYVDDPLALPGPTLTLAPSALSFQVEVGETSAPSATITLENTGSGALTWSAESSESWLTLNASNGNVPATVVATANPSSLQINMLHVATITFTGVAAGYPNQLVTVPVELSIGNSFDNPTGSTPPVPDAEGSLFLPKLSR